MRRLHVAFAVAVLGVLSTASAQVPNHCEQGTPPAHANGGAPVGALNGCDGLNDDCPMFLTLHARPAAGSVLTFRFLDVPQTDVVNPPFDVAGVAVCVSYALRVTPIVVDDNPQLCELYVDPLIGVVTGVLELRADGGATQSLPWLTLPPSLVGATLYCQALTVPFDTPTGLAWVVSNPLQFTIE